jgi:hypothetical protein
MKGLPASVPPLAGRLDANPNTLGVTPVTDNTVKLDGLEIHPLALVPVYGKDDFEKLTNDILNHGLRQPITLFEGKVLDGRNGVEAMKKAGKAAIPAVPFEAPSSKPAIT